MPLSDKLKHGIGNSPIPHAIPIQTNPTPTQNPQNSNDHESQHETPAKELHAKL